LKHSRKSSTSAGRNSAPIVVHTADAAQRATAAMTHRGKLRGVPFVKARRRLAIGRAMEALEAR
jgi:hypothetical protein